MLTAALTKRQKPTAPPVFTSVMAPQAADFAQLRYELAAVRAAQVAADEKAAKDKSDAAKKAAEAAKVRRSPVGSADIRRSGRRLRPQSRTSPLSRQRRLQRPSLLLLRHLDPRTAADQSRAVQLRASLTSQQSAEDVRTLLDHLELTRAARSRWARPRCRAWAEE